MNERQATKETLGAEEARQLLGSGEAKAFDLRDNESWHSYQVPGSHQVEEDSLREALEELPEGTTVMLICEDGERSAKVAAKLREEGLEAISLEGGIESWGDAKVEALPRSDFEYEGPGDKPPGT